MTIFDNYIRLYSLNKTSYNPINLLFITICLSDVKSVYLTHFKELDKIFELPKIISEVREGEETWKKMWLPQSRWSQWQNRYLLKGLKGDYSESKRGNKHVLS